MGLLNTVHREKEGEKQKPTRYYSKRQEAKIASSLSGTRTKNSGATMWEKGDILLDQWLLEAKTKTSSSQSISIQKEWLEKNTKEALFMGKEYNALVFNFGPDEKNYYIIDEYLFQTLVEYLNGKEKDVT